MANPTFKSSDKERANKDYSFLTTSTLPFFIAEKLASQWEDLYPEVELKVHDPQEQAVEEGIVWRIARRVPGRGRENTLKPSTKEQLIDKNSGECLEIVTQWQAVTYEFTVFAHNIDFLYELTDAFEDFLYFLTPELQKRFVNEFLFEEEIREDLASLAKADNTPKRVLRYTAWVHKKFEMSYPLVTKIGLDVGIGYTEIKDEVVLRDDRLRIDFLDLPRTVNRLTRVLKVPSGELVQMLRETQELGPSSGQSILEQNVYIENIDYTFTTTQKEDGSIVPVILWNENKEGSSIPEPGTAYYISYYKPDTAKNTILQPGVLN